MDCLQFVNEVIDAKQDFLINTSKKIWDYAELPYKEYQSMELLCQILEEAGFSVVKNIAKIPTAFVATAKVGDTGFKMGFLGEYDALDALSQQAEETTKKPVEEGAPGHGCGHNLLGVGALGAALALKEYLEVNQETGTVIYYGCPAEEGAGAKQFMAREGVFDEADFIYTWHPSTINGVDDARCNAIMGASFEFFGVSSHAGGSPHKGRSALDTAELMSVGVNYLREHIVDKARVHYAYANTGGSAPNVVHDYTKVKYEVRTPKVEDLEMLFERVVNVGKGAALMVGTQMEYEVTMAFSDYFPNDALAEIANECYMEIGAPKWSDEDYALAKKYVDSYEEGAISNKIRQKDKPLDSKVTPYDRDNREINGGSTDVGDVCYAVPTLNILSACACEDNIWHTWQTTAQMASSIGYKGMLTATKVMALSAIRTMQRPGAVKRAKKITKEHNGGTYTCPLPEETMPPLKTY